MEEKFDYYALFLDEDTRTFLLEKVLRAIPHDWTVYLWHCTILHYSDTKNLKFLPLLDALLEESVEMEVIGIGKNDDVMAFRVNAPSFNDFPHITIAVAPGHKPAESNNITSWQMIPDMMRFKITGKLERIDRK